jgi:hypothetical protein
MYRIIGADGNQYGPISAEQLRQWIAEGRANAQTKVLAEGTTEWKPLSEFPEFFPSASAPGGIAPQLTPALPTLQPLASYGPPAAEQVNGPAIGLMVVSILEVAFAGLSLLFHLIGVSILGMNQTSNQPLANLMSGTVGILTSIFVLLLGGVILVGAVKMKKLENYGLAMAASIIAMLPCSACCIAGLPIGIWSLVVLSKPEVKSAFH